VIGFTEKRNISGTEYVLRYRINFISTELRVEQSSEQLGKPDTRSSWNVIPLEQVPERVLKTWQERLDSYSETIAEEIE